MKRITMLCIAILMISLVSAHIQCDMAVNAPEKSPGILIDPGHGGI